MGPSNSRRRAHLLVVSSSSSSSAAKNHCLPLLQLLLLLPINNIININKSQHLNPPPCRWPSTQWTSAPSCGGTTPRSPFPPRRALSRSSSRFPRRRRRWPATFACRLRFRQPFQLDNKHHKRAACTASAVSPSSTTALNRRRRRRRRSLPEEDDDLWPLFR